jgi:hypothetical protein
MYVHTGTRKRHVKTESRKTSRFNAVLLQPTRIFMSMFLETDRINYSGGITESITAVGHGQAVKALDREVFITLNPS